VFSAPAWKLLGPNDVDEDVALKQIGAEPSSPIEVHPMGEGENEFPALLQRLSSLAATNVTASQGGGSAIASYRGTAGDESLQTEARHHVLTMCAARPARFEGRNSRARSLVYVKQPGALCLVPAGVTPPVRSRTEFELLVCVLDVPFVEGVDAQLENRSFGDFDLQINIKDRSAQQLLKLLLDAANEDAPAERLYTDHLAQALAFRFLMLAKASELRPAPAAPAALPRHAMRRVEERMRDLENDLSLEARAKESGYSPIHFSRMFRAATGHTPHNYVVRLRVERARQLLANSPRSLSEIALECGFSSHSHMTRTFHELVGTTPSTYRRSL